MLSVAALGVTVWVMIDFLNEQEVVHGLIQELPPGAATAAEELEGELRWQFRLTILVVLNVIVTAFAIALLWRAYTSSQETLRDIKALAGDILSSMDQAVITTDLQGSVTSINERGLEMLDADLSCVGRSLGKLTLGVQLEQQRVESTSEESSAKRRDIIKTMDGMDRVLRPYCQTLSDADNNEIGYVLQLRDVTARVLTDDRMRRMERYMGLGALAVGLHHEIKNPLAALSLHVQLLEEEFEAGHSSDEVRRMLSVIRTEMTRVGGVLEGFRDFASPGRLNIAPVNLRDLIHCQIDLIQPRAEEQSVKVDALLPDDLSLDVTGDRVRLEQVLLNLLINALEAMPNGGRLSIAATIEFDMVCVEVSDTGPGVPDDLREKIFDPYFTTKGEGTGLGLALCDKIMRQHDGGLTLQTSTATTFRMSLPLTEPTPQTKATD